MNSFLRRKWITVFLVIVVLCSTLVLIASRCGNFSITLPVDHKPAFEMNGAPYPSELTAAGNNLLDANGQKVVLRGVMPPDPAVLDRKGLFEREFFENMAVTGINVMRIPVHPDRWERDPEYLWRYLDPIVTWNGENGIYTIIDLHFIGNLESGEGGQMPDIHTSSKEFAMEFWRQVAVYFKDTPHVIFEIFNEPAEISVEAWQAGAQDLVDVIRAEGADQLIIVGGVGYARDLSWVLDAPINDTNIAYAAHIYPAHSKYSWDHWFGDVSNKYPVLLTEWGWLDADPTGDQSYLVGNQKTYGEPLMDYLNQRGIGWVACWYDTEWKPNMFDDGFQYPTPYGSFIINALKRMPQ